jgi:glutathionyl-hydroquinone reductase
VTVPLLWDTQTGSIVSNESAEIIRMFNSAFDGITGNTWISTPMVLRPDRRDQRAGLFGHQQRRLQVGVRHQPGRL